MKPFEAFRRNRSTHVLFTTYAYLLQTPAAESAQIGAALDLSPDYVRHVLAVLHTFGLVVWEGSQVHVPVPLSAPVLSALDALATDQLLVNVRDGTVKHLDGSVMEPVAEIWRPIAKTDKNQVGMIDAYTKLLKTDVELRKTDDIQLCNLEELYSTSHNNLSYSFASLSDLEALIVRVVDATLAAKKPKKQLHAAAEKDTVQLAEVFEFWRTTTGHGHVKTLGAGRIKHLRARLEAGYSVDDLKAVIRWAAQDPWMSGTDPKSTRAYLDIQNLMGSDEKMDRYLARAGAKPTGPITKVGTSGVLKWRPVT